MPKYLAKVECEIYYFKIALDIWSISVNFLLHTLSDTPLNVYINTQETVR